MITVNLILYKSICNSRKEAVLPIWAFASNSEDIVILYENDVHCAVEGYSKLSAIKMELQKSYEYVGAVSGGDYIQGNSLGVISQGEFIGVSEEYRVYDIKVFNNEEQENSSTENKYYSFIEILINVILAILSWLF